MRHAFVKTLLELAREDERVFLVTGDLGWTVLDPFIEEFPRRFLNVGVAEQNMMGIATGLALAGHVPFVYSIASFASMRGYEQFRDGAILHSLPVRVVGVGGGFAYGHAGPTHYALEDIALFRTQPSVTVIVPADDAQTSSAVKASQQCRGPMYFRLGKSSDMAIDSLAGRFQFQTPELVRNGSDVLFCACGDVVHEAIRAADAMAANNRSVAVAVLAHLAVRPSEQLVEMLRRFPAVVSVEEGYRSGGLGALIADAIATHSLPIRLHICAVEQSLSCETGSDKYMRARNGLDAQSIVNAATSCLDGLPRQI